MFVTNSVTIDSRVRREAATLAANGNEVVVLGLRDGALPRSETLDGFRVVRVRRDTVHGPLPRGRLRRALLPLGGALMLADYSARALWLAVRRRSDVYHGHDLVTLPVAWAASRLRRSRLVYDAHELFTEIGRLGSLARGICRLLEAALIGRADRVVAVNGSIAQELARRYGIPAPVVIMNCPRSAPQPVSRDASPLRAYAGVPEGAPIVLYQGVYMPHRGLENLVQAARGFTRAHLVLMGWGPLQPSLFDAARGAGVSGRVHFADPVPLEELLRFTAGADLGVIPYLNVGLNNYYTSPNKLFEYCAAGVPIVASRFPELVKVVDELGIGRTFDPERPDDIAAAVNALLDDTAALHAARRNVAAVAGRFTWETESEKLLELYRALVAA
jgi:glycosyltransferase involved in cell wall biosynthesis